MPSLTYAAVVSSSRFVLEAASVAGGLVLVVLLFFPDPTGSLALLFAPLALVAGVVVAWQRPDERSGE